MYYLGIDVSKKYFDVTLLKPSGEKIHAQFENGSEGFAKLLSWLKKQGVSEMHACMEATNIYWEKLAEFLHEQGYKVSVVNPARIKGFAMSQLRRNKTDKLDSGVIVDFCLSQQPNAWIPPTTEQRKLRDMVRRREALVKVRTQQENRIADCDNEESKACWQRIIATLEDEVKTVEKAIAQHIAACPALEQAFSLLRSIKGFGNVTTWTILAEMPDLAEYKDAAAAAADAGVTPAHYESGDTVRRKSKMSRVGKASIRKALYFPALTAMTHNPLLKAFAARLKARGKPTKVIIVAVMRKLMHLAYGVLKNKKPFDPDYGKMPLPAT